MGYLIFTIFFSMWELFCYVFLSICTAQRIELQIILRPPRRGVGIRVCAHSPPPLESIFFVIWRIFLLFFLHVGAFSYVFLFMHITIRVGVTDYVVPPPPQQEKRTKKAFTWNKNSKKVPHL